MIRINTRSHADADDKIATIHRQWLLEGLHYRVARQAYVLYRRRTLEDHGEFIASDPGRKSEGPRRLLQALREAHEYAIAKCVPHAVIKVFEVVQIKEQHANTIALATSALEGGIQQCEEVPAVWQSGQRVARCLFLQGSPGLQQFRLLHAHRTDTYPLPT